MTIWNKGINIMLPTKPRNARKITIPLYKTKLGSMYCGYSEALLEDKSFQDLEGSAQLILTSPPFPLSTKKKYGNKNDEEYIEWLSDFAKLFRNILRPDGSLVVEIGNVWEPGKPTMSTTVLKALLAFLEKGNFHLCQEFIWYNSARLPSPVEWVNKERIRVKDAFTRIWWMSPSERPKADNRKILKEYSPSMKRLLSSRKYNAGGRPSQHFIGKDSFAKDNRGSIPPNVGGVDELLSMSQMISANDLREASNLLKLGNTNSRDRYRDFCIQNGSDMHPARMPKSIPEFFIKFLTDPNDLVVDPFSGSNMTGAVAEVMGRKWISIEAIWEYAIHSIGRFTPLEIISWDEDITIENDPENSAVE